MIFITVSRQRKIPLLLTTRYGFFILTTEIIMAGLKSCPFCGHEVDYRFVYVGKQKMYSVGCLNINCFIDPQTKYSYKTKKSARKAWNKRVNK